MKITIILALMIILISCITTAQAVKIWVEPPYQEVSQGDNIIIDIKVDPEGEEVFGSEYKLNFNNTILNATNQVKGPFLSYDGVSTFVIINDYNSTPGLTEYGEMRMYVEYGVTDPGILASISFNVIAEEGVSNLLLTEVILSRPNASEIYDVNITNGSVEIKPPGICGDVTGNGVVDTGDVILLSNYVGYYPGNPNYALDTAQQWAGDVTGNGVIDTGDVILLSNFVGYTGYSLNC